MTTDQTREDRAAVGRDDEPERKGASAGHPARPPLLAITGPTAVGKTALALAVARHAPAEIVSADSMAVYRGLDIGTAKPTPAERLRASFHLLDVVEPDQPYTLARFLDDARAAIAEIRGRGRLPVVCGGTGLYVSALLRGYSLVPQDPEAAARIRADLTRRLRAEGLDVLAEELRRRDPAGAATLDLQNPRRVLRALEIIALTGRTLAEARRRAETPPYRSVCVVVTCPRPVLYARIGRRVDEMLAAGWLDEVRRLLDAYGPVPALRDAIGYGRLVAYLSGEAGWVETVEGIKRDTRRYAKRQLTWWRRDETCRWMGWETPQDFGAISAVLARKARELWLQGR